MYYESQKRFRFYDKKKKIIRDELADTFYGYGLNISYPVTLVFNKHDRIFKGHHNWLPITITIKKLEVDVEEDSVYKTKSFYIKAFVDKIEKGWK